MKPAKPIHKREEDNILDKIMIVPAIISIGVAILMILSLLLNFIFNIEIPNTPLINHLILVYGIICLVPMYWVMVLSVRDKNLETYKRLMFLALMPLIATLISAILWRFLIL